MFRCFKSALIGAISVASMCVVMSPGCSRQEEVEVYVEPLADDPAATGSGPRGGPGGSQLEALNPPPDEAILYVVPEGWSPVEVSGLRRVTFQIQEGPLSVETTALGLPSTATRLLPNVNLWRKRVGLDHTTQEDMDAAREEIEVDGRRGLSFTLVGPSDAERPLAMLVVLATDQDRTWFFKMFGDSELVLREKEHFEAFVKSVTFVPASGDTAEDSAN